MLTAAYSLISANSRNFQKFNNFSGGILERMPPFSMCFVPFFDAVFYFAIAPQVDSL